MPAASVIAPLILAATFLLSGTAKARDLDSTRSVVQLLRLPRAIQHTWFAAALPAGEILVAALLFAPWRPAFLAAAAAALALCVGYWAVIARALTFRPRPSCGCFGRIGDQRISGKTLARNTVLVALAAVAVAVGATGATTVSLLRGEAWWWLAGCAVAVATAVLIGVNPAGARPVRKAAVPEAASPIPEAAEPDTDYVRAAIPPATVQRPDGSMATLDELATRRAQLLVGVNCTCGSTHETLRRLAEWRNRLPELDVQLLSTLDRAALGAGAGSPGADCLYDHQGLAWDALRLEISPAAVILGADGMLAGGPVSGVEAIEQFVGEIRRELDSSDLPDINAGNGSAVSVDENRVARLDAG